MTFKASLKGASILANPLSSIAELIDEGLFKITPEGLSLTAADRAMVAVTDFNLSKSAFESFEVEGDQSIGISLGNFLNVLKRASGKDVINFELKDNKLNVEIVGGGKRRFVVPLLEITQDEIPQIDQLEFATTAEVKSSTLQSGIDDAEIVSDSVILHSSNDKFVMRAEGDVSSAELELEKGSEDLVSMESGSDSKSRYPLDYFKKMMKAAKIADSVTLQFGQDYPMKLSFKDGDKASLQFVLAPRVSDSD